MSLNGIDISSNNKYLDLNRYTGSIVINKLTGGTSYFWKENRINDCLKKGLLVGAYHFANENGIITIENVVNRDASGGFRIVEDVTTYNSTNEPVKNLISLQELTDFLFDDLRIYLEENFIGTPVRQVTGSLISSFIEAFLQKRVASGMLASYNHSSIQATISGNQAYVSFECAPARELRQIVVEGVYDNFTSSTSSATGTTTGNGINSNIPNYQDVYGQNT